MVALALKLQPFLVAFGGAFALTLVLTPLVREMNRRLGMVDKPDPRRINKVPIPRGGGLAVVLGVFVSYSLFVLFTGRPALQTVATASDALYWKIVVLGSALAAIGYMDDKFSLPPKVKLAGQILIAALVWAWGDLGFRRLWPHLPAWIDCALTVFWITGAINAFNLIDGLDGLASGLALIATLGMGAATAIVHNPQAILFHLAFAGGLLGFLRYNYNPASVFLGDCGSMFVGFILSVLPLVSQTGDSFLVSIGVPLLAMGVPVFDTLLAIVRRTIRGMINRRDATNVGNGKMMTADADHLHHRILRMVGSNQRKAAWILYLIALFLVVVGLLNLLFEAQNAFIWVVAVVVVGAVAVREMSQIELYDAGRLLNEVVHARGTAKKRKWTRFAVPFYLICDVLSIIGSFVFCCWALRLPMTREMFSCDLPTRLVCILFALIVFGVYRTVWARAMIINYVVLMGVCLLGVATGASLLTCFAHPPANGLAFSLFFFVLTFSGMVLVRFLRGLARDVFYSVNFSRMKTRPGATRILVYGAGLRYRSFRRELVRQYLTENRYVVGFIDDNVYLRGKYIGGLKVFGTLNEAPRIIAETKADAVVITCRMSPEWEKIVREILAPTGVPVTYFAFTETEFMKGSKK